MSGGSVDPSTVRQGDRVIVRVAGRSGEGRTVSMAVNDALPAGFEIETLLSPDDADNGPYRFLGKLTAVDAQESRDDRYVATLSLPGRQTFAFAYVARAVTPGDFFLPGVQALDMYHPGVGARSAAGRLKVAPQG